MASSLRSCHGFCTPSFEWSFMKIIQRVQKDLEVWHWPWVLVAEPWVLYIVSLRGTFGSRQCRVCTLRCNKYRLMCCHHFGVAVATDVAGSYRWSLSGQWTRYKKKPLEESNKGLFILLFINPCNLLYYRKLSKLNNKTSAFVRVDTAAKHLKVHNRVKFTKYETRACTGFIFCTFSQ